MKIYKLTVYVLDFDEVGGPEIKILIENSRYPNHCISPSVEEIDVREIGEWQDDSPLNNSKSFKAEVNKLFGPSHE